LVEHSAPPNRSEQGVKEIPGLEGIPADGHEVVPRLPDLAEIRKHVIESPPSERIDPSGRCYLGVVVEHAVHVNAGRDLASLPVDRNHLAHDRGKVFPRANSPKMLAESLPQPSVSDFPIHVGLAGSEHVRGASGQNETDEWTEPCLLMRRR